MSKSMQSKIGMTYKCTPTKSHALTLRYTNLTPLPMRASACAKPHLSFMCFVQGTLCKARTEHRHG